MYPQNSAPLQTAITCRRGMPRPAQWRAVGTQSTSRQRELTATERSLIGQVCEALRSKQAAIVIKRFAAACVGNGNEPRSLRISGADVVVIAHKRGPRAFRRRCTGGVPRSCAPYCRSNCLGVPPERGLCCRSCGAARAL